MIGSPKKLPKRSIDGDLSCPVQDKQLGLVRFPSVVAKVARTYTASAPFVSQTSSGANPQALVVVFMLPYGFASQPSNSAILSFNSFFAARAVI